MSGRVIALGRRVGHAPFKLLEKVPMMRILNLMYGVSPKIGRTSVRLWYRYMTHLDRKAEMIFMNYGYGDPDWELALQPEDESDRYCIQLYHHVAAAVDLAGKDVLEIGCGRGGGASYVARYLKPASVNGMDLAPAAIEFCRSHYKIPGLSYVQGDADDPTFPDATFDAIVNVESSHCYASMERFLGQIRRMLRPGGYFLFADRRDRRGVVELRRQLRESGLELVRRTRITPNILQALDMDEERKMTLIRKGVPLIARKMFKQFAATKGTSMYESFRNGSWEYYSFVLRKPGSSQTSAERR